MNNVAVHDILESDFDAPLTEEVLEELGFEYVPIFPYPPDNKTWNHPEYDFDIVKTDGKLSFIVFIDTGTMLKTVGGVKLLIEALKGDEQ